MHQDQEDGRPTTEIGDVVRLSAGEATTSTDILAREEPLEIRLSGLSVAVTMRTPGDDFDLVSGFLITEGILDALDEIDSIAYCDDEGQGDQWNIVNVNLRHQSSLDPTRWQRNFYAASSCGMCGKASIEAIRLETMPIRSDGQVTASTLYKLERQLRTQQPVFGRTGGLHGALLTTMNGDLLSAREDIGRHNAVDKVIGSQLRSGNPTLADSVLLISGRASFEVVQKAVKVSVPVVAAVSAPSSLAVELARDMGVTLVGFLREGRCNVYANAGRVSL